MKTLDIVRRAGRNLRRAKLRTLLTSVAIAVGGFAITTSLMAGEGARQYVDRIISSNFNPQRLMISKAGETFTGRSSKSLKEYKPDTGTHRGAEVALLTLDDVAKLKARSDLKDVTPLYQLNPKYLTFSAKSDKKYTGEVAMRDNGIRVDVMAGKTMSKGTQLGDNEVMIPESYLEELGVSADKIIGSKLTLTVEQIPRKVSEEDIAKAYRQRGEAGVRELTSSKLKHKELTIVAVSKKSPEQATNTPNTYVSPETAKELTEFATLGTPQYQSILPLQQRWLMVKSPKTSRKLLKMN